MSDFDVLTYVSSCMIYLATMQNFVQDPDQWQMLLSIAQDVPICGTWRQTQALQPPALHMSRC